MQIEGDKELELCQACITYSLGSLRDRAVLWSHIYINGTNEMYSTVQTTYNAASFVPETSFTDVWVQSEKRVTVGSYQTRRSLLLNF